jgi:Pyruvate/2-oxoacid:ferredoxin oxidoreductase delta subunit
MKLSKEEKERRKEHRKINKWNDTHKIIDEVDHKLCNKCNTYNPSTAEYFYPNDKNGIDGLYPYCIKCAIISAADWSKDNREKVLKSKRKYNKTPKAIQAMKDNSKRWRESGRSLEYQRSIKDKLPIYRDNHNDHDITDEEWESCLNYFNWSCAYCTFPYDLHIEMFGQQLHKEHVIHKGSNYVENCVPACRSCNSQKHDKDINEWYNKNNVNFSKRRFNKIIKWTTKDALLI